MILLQLLFALILAVVVAHFSTEIIYEIKYGVRESPTIRQIWRLVRYFIVGGAGVILGMILSKS